jgi:hypothetical protein
LANALEEQVEVAQTNLTLNLMGTWDKTELELAIEKIRHTQYQAVYVIGPKHFFQPLLDAAKMILRPDYL